MPRWVQTGGMAPVFSVVIPTHGRPAFVDAAIRSVLAQTFTDYECIVVDDASSQAPELPDDPRLRLIVRSVNGGPGATRNTGIDAATGTYLAFLDDDDIWLPDRLLAAHDAHARAPLAVCWQSTLGAPAPTAPGRALEGDVTDTILDDITPHLGATSIERDRAPLFDERYDTCEDVDWWMRVAADCPVTTISSVGFVYRRHTGPRDRTSAERRVTGAQMLLREHADWFAAHPRAKAFRLKRLGLAALALGDNKVARESFMASLRLRPEPRTVWHALRALARPKSAATSG
jgi:glycosyltransferase involved in cell wall biosynthesis